MKKLTLLSAVAVAGLLGFSARAATPVDYDIVTVKLTVTVSTNISEDVSKLVKIKVTTKDILAQIATRFDETFPAGAKLAVDEFFDGEFAVLDKDNGVIIADASTTSDDYELYIDYDTYVYGYTDVNSKEKYDYSVESTFDFENLTGTDDADLEGTASVKETYSDAKDSETFSFTGSGEGKLNGVSAIITGTVTGDGPDNESID